MVSAKGKSVSFEEALVKLEKITNDLQSGKLNLKEAVDAYEEGLVLKQYAEQHLSNAQTRLSVAGEPNFIKDFDNEFSAKSIELKNNLLNKLRKKESNIESEVTTYAEHILLTFTKYLSRVEEDPNDLS